MLACRTLKEREAHPHYENLSDALIFCAIVFPTNAATSCQLGQFLRMRIGIAYAASCTEGLHFSAFHWVCVCHCVSSVRLNLTYGH